VEEGMGSPTSRSEGEEGVYGTIGRDSREGGRGRYEENERGSSV